MKRFLKEWGVFSLIISLLVLSRLFVWSFVTVDGHSMDPTLQDKERLLMVKVTPIERFDIVVAKETDDAGNLKRIVKRVIGMPGDTIRYENDTLYINDQKVEEPYLAEYLAAFQKDKLQEEYSYNQRFQLAAQSASHFTLDSQGQSSFTVTVPQGQYFLMGDDRLVSRDSRSVGTFQAEDLEGEIVFRLWPINKIGGLS